MKALLMWCAGVHESFLHHCWAHLLPRFWSESQNTGKDPLSHIITTASDCVFWVQHATAHLLKHGVEQTLHFGTPSVSIVALNAQSLPDQPKAYSLYHPSLSDMSIQKSQHTIGVFTVINRESMLLLDDWTLAAGIDGEEAHLSRVILVI